MNRGHYSCFNMPVSLSSSWSNGANKIVPIVWVSLPDTSTSTRTSGYFLWMHWNLTACYITFLWAESQTFFFVNCRVCFFHILYICDAVRVIWRRLFCKISTKMLDIQDVIEFCGIGSWWHWWPSAPQLVRQIIPCTQTAVVKRNTTSIHSRFVSI